MRIPVKLRSVVFDVKTLKPGMTRLEFFQDDVQSDVDSATAATEADLVRWLIEEPRRRAALFDELSLSPTAVSYAEVRSPFITNPNKKPGDIDLLLCEARSPDQAIVVECKRVKIRAVDGTERINRLDALGGADAQARALFRLGFCRTYLGVVAITDGRANDVQNFMFRGTSDATYCRIIEFAGTLTLPEDVGIVYIEIVQPVQRAISEAGVLSVAVAREAKRRVQPADVTARVDNYVHRNV